MKLHLVLGGGKAKISLLGYHQAGLDTVRQEFGTEIVELEQGVEWEYEFPENDEQMVGFELAALSPELEIRAGYFTIEVDEKKLQPVKLAIATTTCRKEDFIRKNVGLIRQELLEQDTEVAQNLFLHVVDNGQTLTEKEIKGRHVYLHPNRNTGGSGGFSRGMIEAMRQKPVATHVLLMDDDVLVLPESIYRTYMLLRALKPEYRECFVEGAMLHYEEPHLQHEDIGTVKYNERGLKPLKGILDQTLLANNLQTETIEPPAMGGYGAWWFCCIPAATIRREGLPLPLFVRFDDVEYGNRCRPLHALCISCGRAYGARPPGYHLVVSSVTRGAAFCPSPLCLKGALPWLLTKNSWSRFSTRFVLICRPMAATWCTTAWTTTAWSRSSSPATAPAVP